MPTLSVVIAAYNEYRHLPDQLRAIVPQLRPCDELILVNDGSTDGTRRLMSECKFDPLIFVSQKRLPDGNANRAFNRGVRFAGGDVIYCASGNDTVQPGAFKAALAGFQRSPSMGVVCGYCAEFPLTWDEGPISLEQMLTVWERAPIHGAATFIRRDLWDRYGGYNEELGSLADWWLYHLVAARHGMAYVKQRISRFRMHTSCHADARDQEKRATIVAELARRLHLPEFADVKDAFHRSCLFRGNWGGYF